MAQHICIVPGEPGLKVWRTPTMRLETKAVVCLALASGLTGDGGEGCTGLEEPMAVFPGILFHSLSCKCDNFLFLTDE